MSDPTDPYRASDPYQPPATPPAPVDPYKSAEPYPVSGTPATAPLPSPHPPQPASYVAYPAASGAYGYDPVTGQPLSDKSKVMAGLLQIVLGFVFTLGGVGRLYAGHTAIGVVQLVASVVAWASFWCGFALAFPFVIWFGVWLWFLIDGVVMIAGRSVDGQGRLLRA